MANWDGRSKGTTLGYRFFFALIKTFGLSSTYFFLRIISFYYFLFAIKKRKALIDFYISGLGFSKELARKTAIQNFYEIGRSLVDRYAMAMGLAKEISYRQSGEEALLNWANSGEGGILLSGHLGNWAVAGHLLQKKTIKVNVLMYQNEVAALENLFQAQGATPNFKIIGIKADNSHLIKIYTAIKNGEFVCINADRYLTGAKTLSLKFLNRKALFPEGPFTLIEKLKANYAIITAVKSGKFEYFFTTTEKTNPEGKTAVEIGQQFANALGDLVKSNPEQWYNYYDFFNQPAQ